MSVRRLPVAACVSVSLSADVTYSELVMDIGR